jgi:hypothetical protein
MDAIYLGLLLVLLFGTFGLVIALVRMRDSV